MDPVVCGSATARSTPSLLQLATARDGRWVPPAQMPESERQPVVGAMRARLDRSHRHPQARCDLLGRESLKVLQTYDLLLLGGQRRDRLANLPPVKDRIHPRLIYQRRVVGRDVVQRPGGPGGLAAVQVDRHPTCDGRQPRPQLARGVKACPPTHVRFANQAVRITVGVAVGTRPSCSSISSRSNARLNEMCRPSRKRSTWT